LKKVPIPALLLQPIVENAIDYLLKPVEPERLAKAIDKLQRLTGDDRKTFETQLQHLMAHLKKPKSRRIQVRNGDRIRLLNPKDIRFFKASDKYVEGHTYDQSYLLNQTLNQREYFVSIGEAIGNEVRLKELKKKYENYTSLPMASGFDKTRRFIEEENTQ